MLKLFINRYFFVLLGPLFFIILFSFPTPSAFNDLSWKLVAALTWILIWWSTEAVPIPVTSLLPILLFPALGILETNSVLSNYSKPIIFMFMGGFFIASSLEKWQLHKRFALGILQKCGQRPEAIIAGFMFATAALSMWISNTATTIMMMAIAMSITDFLNQNIKNPKDVLPLNKALMLSIAYAASIGGTATLIGTPPNLFFASFLEDQFNMTIDMLSWMKIGVPFMLIMLPTAWFWLSHICYNVKTIELPNIQEVLKQESSNFKKMTLSELSVVGIFVLTATLWIFKLKINTGLGWSLSDADIALFSALLLFCLPASLSQKQFLLDWKTAQEIPWGILLMFGGGLSVALSFSATGLTETLANSFTSLSNLPPLLFLAVLALFSLFSMLSKFLLF